MTAPTTLADAHVEAQSVLADQLGPLVAAIMSTVDVQDLPGSQARVAQQVRALRLKYGRASVALALSHFRQVRQAAGVTSPLRLDIPKVPVADDGVDTAVGWVLSGLYGPQNDELVTVGSTAYAPIQQRLADAQTKLQGVAEKVVVDQGRDATLSFVQQDKQAKRWARQPEADPCAFCALLASRGPVYKADTVEFEAHDHCRCQPVPVYGTWQPSPQIIEWQSLYADSIQYRRDERPMSRTTGERMNAMSAFRRVYDAGGVPE